MTDERLRPILLRLQGDLDFRERFAEAPRTALAEYDLSDEDMHLLVLPSFGWLIPGAVAGASRPRSDDALIVLRDRGIRAVLTLTEQPLPESQLAKHALSAAHVPIADFTAPTTDQIRQAVAAIDHFRGEDKPVVVHCGAGLGRTGTILASYLVSQGLPAGAAIERVRSLRPGSVETPEQEAVVMEYERELRGNDD